MPSSRISFKRQLMIFDPKEFEDKIVAIVGLGNIGSHTALALARLGIKNFLTYDPDTIEAHNLSSQAYTEHSIGKYKGAVVSDMMSEINPGIADMAFNRKFDPRYTSETQEMRVHMPNIVIIAVDSMKERKKISEMYRTAHWPDLLIDARVGGNQLEVYNIRSWDEWQKTFSDSPDQDPCGGRYISYVSLMVAGVIANQVKKFLKGERMDKNVIVDANTLQVIKDIQWKD